MAEASPLSFGQRILVVAVAFSGLVFDGFELGLMPQASLSVSESLLGADYTKKLGGEWFAWFTASLMLGAAVGGIVLGNLGDRIGRTKAMALSILIYSIFAGLGAYVETQEQMLVLRFLVGMGTGGMLPNGIALVAECWPNASRPFISGLMGAGINVGIALLSWVTQWKGWEITAESWRWLFKLAALPAAVGIFAMLFVPESPTWLAKRGMVDEKKRGVPLGEMFGPGLLRLTILGILLGAIPLIGAWAASKWMIPWADEVASEAVKAAESSAAKETLEAYKGSVQLHWAIGAICGSFAGAFVAGILGRIWSYFLISLGAVASTWSMFKLTAPLEPEFVWVVLVQGFVSTLFFGWLPLYLPELFPTRVRATGMGLSYNVGRFATAFAVLVAGSVLALMGNSKPAVGATFGLVYGLGMLVIWWAPDTSGKSLE